MKIVKIGQSIQRNKDGSHHAENVFLITSVALLSGLKSYFASERLPFWSLLKKGDTLVFEKHVSPKFGDCLRIAFHNDKAVGSRHILVHGSNEDGSVSVHNSDNCLIPLQSEYSEELFRKEFSLNAGKMLTKSGVSKKITTSKCKEMEPGPFTIKITDVTV